MKKILVASLAVLAALLVALATALVMAVEEPPDGPAPTDRFVGDPAFENPAAAASAQLAKVDRESGPPSISVAVGVGSQLAWAETIGYAFVADAEPATLRSKYRIGSVSKPLTAVAAGVLMDAGKLDLDADFHSLVPDFPTKQYRFTLRQLGGHLAGIRHYRAGFGGMRETYNQSPYATVRASLEFIEADPLAFEPGTDFLYSSYGYNMLSVAIEAAADEPFLALMDRVIFAPLAMTDSSPDFQDRPVSNVVGFYIQSDDVLLRSIDVDNSYKWAGGGFLSTPSDLVKFGQALLGDGLISAETRAQLWRPQRLSNGEINPQSYGVGFRAEEKDGRLRVGHGGASVGGVTSFVVYPREAVVVAVTSNVTPFASPLSVSRLAVELAEPFLALSD